MHSEPPPPSVCPSFLCILCKQSQDLLWRSPEVLPMLGLSAHIQARVSWDITASNCSLLHLSWSSPSSHKKPMGHMQFSFHLLLSSMKTTTSKKPWPGDYTGDLTPSHVQTAQKSRHASRTALLGQAEDQVGNPKGHPTGLPWPKKQEFKPWSLHISQACTWRSPVVDCSSSSSSAPHSCSPTNPHPQEGWGREPETK